VRRRGLSEHDACGRYPANRIFDRQLTPGLAGLDAQSASARAGIFRLAELPGQVNSMVERRYSRKSLPLRNNRPRPGRDHQGMKGTNSRRRARALMGVALLAATLASSAPVTRWCPMPWDRVPAAMYLHCSLFPAAAPMRYALASPCATSCSRACETSTPPAKRAYCLGDPGLASVWRPQLRTPRNPSAVVAVLVAVTALAPPAPAFERSRGLEPQARPPSADPAARPPVRGPPLERPYT
jgi:hypothetical protein